MIKITFILKESIVTTYINDNNNHIDTKNLIEHQN